MVQKGRFTQQRGAVLAFSLIMLMLFSLVGATVMTQNKVQLSMTSNARQQSQSLATIESALGKAQNLVDGLRYRNQSLAQCNSTNQIDENRTLNLGDSSQTAKIAAVYCLSNYIAGVGGNEQRCTYTAGVRDDISACSMLSNAGSLAGCDIEVYTINLNVLDNTTGAKRVIEAKYEVDCTGDTHPPSP